MLNPFVDCAPRTHAHPFYYSILYSIFTPPTLHSHDNAQCTAQRIQRAILLAHLGVETVPREPDMKRHIVGMVLISCGDHLVQGRKSDSDGGARQRTCRRQGEEGRPALARVSEASDSVTAEQKRQRCIFVRRWRNQKNCPCVAKYHHEYKKGRKGFWKRRLIYQKKAVTRNIKFYFV